MRTISEQNSADKESHYKIGSVKNIKLHIKDYCRSSSIHGFKYLSEEDRTLFERFGWFWLFLLCIILNAYLICKVWIKWTDSPVIVSFAEMTTPVWNVPFPAVTICSEVKSRATVFNFTASLADNGIDDIDERKKGEISLLCNDDVKVHGENFINETTYEFLEEVAPPFLDTIFLCKWNNYVSQNCSDVFTKIVTDEGICYTFNMLDKEDLFRENVKTYFESDGLLANGWTLDKGYDSKSSLVDVFPRRALMSGTARGLFTVLKALRDDADYSCKGPIGGFKILLHNPAEFPMVGEHYLRVPLNQEVLIVVQPSIMTTSEGLLSYTPEQRHCYFPSERYLSYFKVYTQPNCELECLTNYTRRECGCVALHMPRKADTKVCGPGKKQCMIKAEDTLIMSEVNASYRSETMGKCNCLPACTSIGYNAEFSQADFHFLEVLEAYGENITTLKGYEASRLTIFFKDMQFTTSRRNELYGTVDFMANCGGILGLFIGISFLSIVELLYYITLRIWGNAKAAKKAFKKSQEALNSKLEDKISIN